MVVSFERQRAEWNNTCTLQYGITKTTKAFDYILDPEHPQHDSEAQDSQPQTRLSFKQHLSANIEPDLLAEIELLCLTISTGIQDVTTFPDYHCFASNQTGNTVLLAVAIIGLPGREDGPSPLFIPANVGISLGCFLLTAFISGQIGNAMGSKRRPYLIISNLIQTLMVFAAAALQFVYGVHVTGASDRGVIALLALASGAQVALSRSLHVNEIPTGMATAAWVDTMVDPYLLSLHNRKRNRRVTFILALFVGGLIGVSAMKGVSSAFAIVISGILKAIVTISLFFNTAVRKENEKNEGHAERLKEAVQEATTSGPG